MPLLDDYLAEREAVPFGWAVQDCCSFMADWVLLARGRDPIAQHRGYTGALALRILRSLGGPLEAGRKWLGEPIHSLFADVGDICLVPTGHRGRHSGLAFGICNGRLVAAPGFHGLVYVPITDAVAAWRL